MIISQIGRLSSKTWITDVCVCVCLRYVSKKISSYKNKRKNFVVHKYQPKQEEMTLYNTKTLTILVPKQVEVEGNLPSCIEVH